MGTATLGDLVSLSALILSRRLAFALLGLRLRMRCVFSNCSPDPWPANSHL